MKNAIIWLIVGCSTATIAFAADKNLGSRYQKPGINKLTIDGKTCNEKTCEGDVIFIANPTKEAVAVDVAPYFWQQRQRFPITDLIALVGRSCTLGGLPSGFDEVVKSCEEVDKLTKLEEDKKKKEEKKTDSKVEPEKKVDNKLDNKVEPTAPVKDKS